MILTPFIRASKGEDGPELWVSGEIGVDTVANDVLAALKFYNRENVVPILNIYCHGGGLDDANAFYGYVEQQGVKAKVRIWGTAMSAAVTYAAAFGSQNIEIHPLATIMVHECSGGTEEMRVAGNNSLIAVYRKLTGLSEKKLRDMIAATTTLSAQQAVEMGFASRVMKSDLKLAAYHSAVPLDINEQPQTMKVKGKLTGTWDTVKALASGSEVEVEIDPTAELKAAADALEAATLERQAAEAKAKEATDNEEALKAKVDELTGKLTETEAAVQAAQEKAATELEAVTSQLTEANGKVANLTADLGKLKAATSGVSTAKAISLTVDGDAVDPTNEPVVLSEGAKLVKAALSGVNPLMRAQMEQEAAKK